jgi:hypothetical protein
MFVQPVKTSMEGGKLIILKLALQTIKKHNQNHVSF